MKKLSITIFSLGFFFTMLLGLGLFSSSAMAFDPHRRPLPPPPHVMAPPPPPPVYRHPQPYHQPYHVERRRKNNAGKAIAIGAAALMLGIIINEAARR